MQSRREQVHAHRFMTRRIVSALLSGEPDSADRPMQRLGLAVLASAMVAMIVFVGVGVYGLRNPGGARRPGANTLVIERETGARYVVLADGVLHPVLNYASARLILGAQSQVRMMSRSSLTDLPRGQAVGIREAPDALPAPSSLVSFPWTICSAPRSADVGTPTTSLYLGHQRGSGAPGTGTELGDTALLVTDHAAGTRYLIRDGLRLKITHRDVLTVLGLDSATPVPVGQALLNGIPAGPDLPPSLPRSGSPNAHGIRLVSQIAKVGQVYRVDGRYYVMTDQGLSAVSEVGARLFGLGGPAPRTATLQEARGAFGSVRVPDPLTTMPSPHPANTGTHRPAVCAIYRGGSDSHPGGGRGRQDDGHDVTVQVLDQPPHQGAGEQPEPDPGGASAGGLTPVDHVVVPGGHGALVQEVPVRGASVTGTATYLVTDQGIKYQIPTDSPDTTAALGYAGVSAAPVLSTLLNLIPSGPLLDPKEARQFSGR
jgi:type VII secretion protein EccB